MGKTKLSKVKRGNIKRTKLTSQGKIKSKRHKKTVVKSKPQPVKPAVEEEEEEESDHGQDFLDMVEKDDLEFLKQAISKRSYSLFGSTKLEAVDTFSSKKKRKLGGNEENDDLEEQYENEMLTDTGNKRTRHLLPIKTDSGLVRRAVMEEIKESKTKPSAQPKPKIEDEDDDLIHIEKPERDISKPVTVANMLAWREEAVARYKFRIGILSSGLLENPQEKVGNITILLEMFDDWQPELQVTIKKLVIVSLLEVFKDILPSYQIKHQESESVKLKKDTKQLQMYEKRLLKGYRNYLTKLEKLASRLYKKRGDTRVITKQHISLGELAIKCMCELLRNHLYFNYSKNIVVLLTPYLDNRYPSVRSLVHETYTHIFIHDKRGEITLDAVRRINDLVKKRKHAVKCEVLSVLSALKLQDINLDDSKDAEIKQKKVQAKKSRIMNLSKKEKKRQKRLKEVEKELLETKAEENKKNRHATMTEVTKTVFTIYFRILKNAPSSGLLSTALQGIAKFANCINIDFYHDLVIVLSQLMENEELKLKEELNCEMTVFSILSGHADAFNIDPNKFFSHLYCSMMKINAGRSSEHSRLLVECLEKVVIGNRKKLTNQRLLAFIKRMATIALHQEHHTALGCLAIIKHIFQTNRYVDCLLEADSSIAQGVYLPELPEPEHCNASSTALFELLALKRHYHPIIRKLALHVLNGAPGSGTYSLPPEITKLSSKEMYDMFDPSQVAFRPAIPPPNSKHKENIKPANILRDKDLSTLCDKVLATDLKVDFSPLYYHNEKKIKVEGPS